MPNLYLTNLKTCREYLELLASQHMAIDGFKWGDADIIKNDNRSDLPDRFLWGMPYDKSQYGDSGSDNVVKSKVLRMAYMIVPSSEKFSEQDEAFDFCEKVMEQVMARIFKDKMGKMEGSEWILLATNVNTWSGGPVEKKIGSTHYIGWEMQVTFMDNTGLVYDAEVWAID
jgi:hypothetical protein